MVLRHHRFRGCHNHKHIRQLAQLAGVALATREVLHQRAIVSVVLIGDVFCILNGQYTVVGPTCWGSTCYTGSTASACNRLGGTNIGDVFCILEGDNWEVVGPTCNGNTCYTGSTASACNRLGGTNIGDVFCILKEGKEGGSNSASVHTKYFIPLMLMVPALFLYL